MVASAIRMRTPSAMFVSRGAATVRRPQVSSKLQEVMKYVLLNQLLQLIDANEILCVGPKFLHSPLFPDSMPPSVWRLTPLAHPF